ncbi:MAG: hypothetical protein K0S90_3004 [Enterobacteriaceae bacterium]|nr:hypothetical protein [Enterobacteriaceae bacterium]
MALRLAGGSIPKKTKGLEISLQPLLYLVAPAGFEPATKRL